MLLFVESLNKNNIKELAYGELQALAIKKFDKLDDKMKGYRHFLLATWV